MVPQHASLFHGSVAENLRIARPDASDEDLVVAARSANAHGFVTDLPEGYATPIGEGGVRLSGGERQRLALAGLPQGRAAPDLGRADVASRSRERIARARVGLATHAGRTVLVIAHRPEPVADADVVVSLRAGRVVGDQRPEPSDAPNGRVARIAFEARP